MSLDDADDDLHHVGMQDTERRALGEMLQRVCSREATDSTEQTAIK